MDLRRDARIVVVMALVAGGVPRVAIAQAPNDSYYNFLMGRHLEGEDNIQGALAALDRAAKADPKAAEVQAEIARLHYRRENREEAEKAAKAALAIDSKNFEANRILGTVYAGAAANERNTAAQAEMYVREAITYLERAQAAAEGPPDPNLNYMLGRMYTVSGQPAKGVEALRRVVSQSPYSVPARMALAQAFAATGDLRSAASTLEEVADESPAALAEMAKYQAGAGLYSDAITSYTRALQSSPNNQQVKLQRIIAALEAKQYQQAADFAAQAQQQHQGEATFPRLQAMALLELGNKQRALEVLESAAAKFPRDVETQFKLADVYADAGRPTDAERMLRQMLTVNPADHRALNYLGYLLAQNGKDLEEAIKLVNRALAADPGRGEYLDSLGWAYYKQGNLGEAEKYLSQAAQKLPDHPEILDHLGDVYAKRGRWQEAIDAWTKALASKEDGIDPSAVQRKLEDARGRVGR